MAKKIPIDIELNTRAAQQSAKQLNKELQGTEDSLGDVESAGKTMARAIQMQADDMIREIDDTRRAVDALERALGPDFTADPTDVVAELKKVGLTAQEIEVDAEDLAAAIRRIDDVKVSANDAGFDDLNKVITDTETKGKASSVAIGGIGGSVSELPGVGNLGAIAESMGQLAEGALEGDINTKQLVGTIGALAGTAAAMYVINKVMTSMSETKAFHKEQVNAYKDAIVDAGSAADGLLNTLREARDIKFREKSYDFLGGLIENTSTADQAMYDLNVTVEDFVAAATGSKADLDAFIESIKMASIVDENDSSMIDYNATLEAQDDIISAVTQSYNDNQEALKAAEVEQALYGKTAEDTAKSQDKNKKSTQDATDAINAQREATDAAIASNLAHINSDLGYRNQVADTAEAIRVSKETTDDASTAVDEYAQAQRDAEGAVYAQADAAVQLATDQAAAYGVTLTQTEQAKIYKAELEKLVGTLDGPAKEAVQGYIDGLKGIPTTINTRVTASIPNVLVNTNVRGAGAFGTTIVGATGGIVTKPTMALIGEAGPEAVVPLNQAPGASPLPGGMGGNTYVTINTQADPQMVIDAIRKWERKNGSLR